VLLIALGFVKSGCDYSLVEEPVIIPGLKISVTPQTAQLQKGTTLHLSAVISGFKSNGDVTWEFADTAGLASGSTGQLTANALTALYTAPATLATAPLLVSIRVRSVEDTSRYATAILTILDSTTNGGATSLSIAPLTVTIAPGATQQFTASVTGITDTAVTWRIVTGMGMISASGLYAAPDNAPSQTVVIEAALVADPSITARATVNIRKPIDPNLVCFERDVMPIFANNCAVSGCHTASNPNPPDGIRLDTYAQIKAVNGNDNEILDVITEDDSDKIMPPPDRKALTSTQIDIIRRWIAQGLKNEPCEDTSTVCDTLDLSFALNIQPIFEAQCTGCHGNINPERGINLTTHAGIRAVAQTGQLVGSITHTSPYIPMPYSIPGAPREKLDDCSIDKIKAWINAGSPNN